MAQVSLFVLLTFLVFNAAVSKGQDRQEPLKVASVLVSDTLC
jgi:hypothetical protein